MKIEKVGRERPVLYRGKFSVPTSIVERLILASSQISLAYTTSFTTTIDLLYLGIDNIMSAFIMTRAGTLTTTSHREKIELFVKYFGKKARLSMIEKTDLETFFKMWQACRYKIYAPKWSTIHKMKLFTSHLMNFAIREIAREFKSDESILCKKIAESIKFYQIDTIDDIAAQLMESYQIKAEQLGEMYGGKLSRKLLNHWNFINVSLFTDNKEIARIIDKSEEFQKILGEIIERLDELTLKIAFANWVRLSKQIMQAKLKKGISKKAAIKQAATAATKHSDLLKIRFGFNFGYDSSEPKETLEIITRIIGARLSQTMKYPNKVPPDKWEALKLSYENVAA